MEQPAVSLPPKRPRRSDYEEMRTLTESYLRKVRRTLEEEHCDHAGALQSSLQRYFASDQFARDHSDAVPKTSVLAFIMHAAEVAVSQRAEEPKEEPKKVEMASQTISNDEPPPVPVKDPTPNPPPEPTPPVPVAVHPDPVTVPATPLPDPKPAEPTTHKHAKTIFKTEQGRKGGDSSRSTRAPRKSSKATPPPGLGKAMPKPIVPAPVPTPPQPYYPPAPEVVCDTCGDKFWNQDQMMEHRYEVHPQPETQNYDSANAIPCPIFGCDEHFEDNSDLLLHMRTFHSS